MPNESKFRFIIGTLGNIQKHEVYFTTKNNRILRIKRFNNVQNYCVHFLLWTVSIARNHPPFALPTKFHSVNNFQNYFWLFSRTFVSNQSRSRSRNWNIHSRIFLFCVSFFFFFVLLFTIQYICRVWKRRRKKRQGKKYISLITVSKYGADWNRRRHTSPLKRYVDLSRVRRKYKYFTFFFFFENFKLPLVRNNDIITTNVLTDRRHWLLNDMSRVRFP